VDQTGLTPLFVEGLIGGLIFVAIGLAIRSSFPNRSAIGIFVIVIGAIPALLCTVALAWDSAAKWTEARRTRRSVEQLTEERDIQGIRFSAARR
jgi:hypothetical protein